MYKKSVCFFLGLFFLAASALAADKRFVEFTSFRKDLNVSQVKLGDNVWRTVSPYRQPLQRQFLEVPKPAEIGVKEVYIQSVNDGKYIAFRLVWKDESKNDRIKLNNYSDGAAIQFPVSKDAFPEFFMGEKNKAVHILFWRAWRSRDREAGFQNVKTAYPNMTVDIYTFDYPIKGKGTEKTQAEKNIFIPGRAAKNPLSFPSRRIISELTAQGPGTITSKNTENTSGDARWANGEWTVLFTRPLTVKDSGSVQFKSGQRTLVAFAVWEGSRMEVGGRKAVSPAWAEVEVE